MSPFWIPLGVFVVVVLIVAIVSLARIHGVELEVHHKLHAKEMEHQRRMRELDLDLERIKQGS